MDDTTLVTSDINAMTDMLNIANKFYAMNNTKINFSKADLITNRDPSNPSIHLPRSPVPFTFNLERASFSITPLASDSSFRFLGVWFSIKGFMSFIKQQCRTKYSTFAAKLRKKKLTTKQLVYLHNTVLLPKVEYRLMTTVFTQDKCHRISAPMKAIIKQSSKFAITLPTAFLHYEREINMTNLYNRHLQNHISSIPRRFHASSILSNIYLIRLHQLSDSLWIPFSPTNISDFSLWKFTKTFKSDLLIRTFHFASSIGFNFSLAPYLSFINSAVKCPIHEFFSSNPRLFARSIAIFKRNNIRCLSQCITDNGSALLPYKSIMRNHSHPVSLQAGFHIYKHNCVSQHHHSSLSRLFLILTYFLQRSSFPFLLSPIATLGVLKNGSGSTTTTISLLVVRYKFHQTDLLPLPTGN
jgi:hypothetical protein